MAKGNDGNYLQHCIEVEAAVHLAQMDGKGRLHIALTHGMAPFESFDVPFDTRKADGTFHKILKKKLADSKKPQQVDEAAVVKAYRITLASDRCYPNSAELLKAIIGKDNLSGGITEINRKKHDALSSAWFNTGVKTNCSSWREEVHPNGILACPEDIQIPWLFTMDPMTYVERGDMDDSNLHRFDIDILSGALSRYFNSGKPGIASLFVYNVGVQYNNAQRQFVEFMKDLKGHIEGQLSEFYEVAVSFYSLPHIGGNRNLAGLFHSSQFGLSSNLILAGLEAGITPGRKVDL